MDISLCYWQDINILSDCLHEIITISMITIITFGITVLIKNRDN